MGDMTIRPEDAPKVTEQVTESDVLAKVVGDRAAV